MIPEAAPRVTSDGLVPEEGGWYVLNATETRWVGMDGLWRGAWLEPEGDPWPDLGFHLTVLDPGCPMAMYHAESLQEDFLVVSGECVLLIEGEERMLHAWDFVHCPPWTEHVLVGAGTTPALVVAVSSRAQDRSVRYVASDLARSYDAAPPHDTDSPDEAYRGRAAPRLMTYRDGDLPIR